MAKCDEIFSFTKLSFAAYVLCSFKSFKSKCTGQVRLINLFTHGAPRSSQELLQKCPCIPDRIGIWKCWFLRRGGNWSTRRKTSRSRVENQQQPQPTYDAGSGNQTRATLVGGEHSHHCANPAPLAGMKAVKANIKLETENKQKSS